MTNGYPDDDDLDELRKQLNTDDFLKGADCLAEMIENTENGFYDINRLYKKATFGTNGWSGCEDIMEAAQGTMWWAFFWKSTHRGGLYTFGVNS